MNWNFKYFLILSLFCGFFSEINSSSSSGHKHHKHKKCPPLKNRCKCGDNLTPIKNLWSLTNPDKLTPNIKELKDVIIKLAEYPKYTGSAMGASLWTQDMLNEYRANPSPSCVYIKLMKATINKDSCELKKAVADYGKLCDTAITYSVNIGLAAAGCPVKRPRHWLKPKVCALDEQLLNEFLESSNTPVVLKPIIKKLHESDLEDDNRVAVAVVATFSGNSIKLFDNLLKDDSFIEVVQLKGCKQRIPKRCCKKYKKVLKEKCGILSKHTAQQIQDIIATL